VESVAPRGSAADTEPNVLHGIPQDHGTAPYRLLGGDAEAAAG